jgi:uncharacterized metal-binding protein YceD (DUF177 family)
MLQGQIEDGMAHARVCITPRHDYFTLECEVQGKITVACDRCLGALTQEIEARDTLTVRLGEEELDEGDDVVIVARREGMYDVAGFLRELIVLSLPMRLVHEEGECDTEMEERLAQWMDKGTEEGTDEDIE